MILMQNEEHIAQATDWVIAQAKSQKADLKTNGYAWTTIVDDAVDRFDLDIEQLEESLRKALSISMNPESPWRANLFTAIGLKVTTDPVEVAKFRAMVRNPILPKK